MNECQRVWIRPETFRSNFCFQRLKWATSEIEFTPFKGHERRAQTIISFSNMQSFIRIVNGVFLEAVLLELGLMSLWTYISPHSVPFCHSNIIYWCCVAWSDFDEDAWHKMETALYFICKTFNTSPFVWCNNQVFAKHSSRLENDDNGIILLSPQLLTPHCGGSVILPFCLLIF